MNPFLFILNQGTYRLNTKMLMNKHVRNVCSEVDRENYNYAIKAYNLLVTNKFEFI